MLRKLKYVLPIAQMALAVILHWASWHWSRAASRGGSDSPGNDIFFTLCVALNAPAGLLRVIFYRFADDYWDAAMFVLAIGLLWYWVSVSVEAWRQGRTVIMFKYPPLRLTADVLLVGVGVVCASLAIVRGHFGPMSFSPYFLAHWQIVLGQFLVEFFLLGWAFLLVTLFGRDFTQAVLDYRHRIAR